MNQIIEEEKKKLSPFDFVKNIDSKGERFSDEDIEEGYVPFVINRNYSLGRDTIFFADLMNTNSSALTKKMQYDFYYNILPKSRRYNKWDKKDTKLDDDMNKIQTLYGYSYNKALQVLPLFKDTAFLDEQSDTGGKITKKVRKTNGN